MEAVVEKVDMSSRKIFSDVLAIEEPLEIRLDFEREGLRQQKSISITMRTPGHDFELAAGFLFTEGIVTQTRDISKISHCGPKRVGGSESADGSTTNVIKVQLAETASFDFKSLERHFYTSSSCGVCGKSSIEALKTRNIYNQGAAETDEIQFSSDLVHFLPDRLRAAQSIFENTGGLHASGLFSSDGKLISLFEDVGRHNALDKVIGDAFLKNQMPLDQSILLVSGRVSFELVQKASMAGIRILAAVGAPSSLALQLAQEMRMTLLGFVRNQKFNVYCGKERII
jgi:FdhD protein